MKNKEKAIKKEIQALAKEDLANLGSKGTREEKRLLRQANAKLKSRIRKVGKKKKCNSDMFLTGFNMVLFIVGFINTFAMLL